MRSTAVRLWGLHGIPEIKPGDDLGQIILEALREGADRPPRRGVPLRTRSILVVAQKVVSKSEGRIVPLAGIEPSEKAFSWARRYCKDARVIEVILRQARRLVRMDRGVLIVETPHGFICANGGVDASNAPIGTVILLPEDPDASARRIQDQLEKSLRRRVAVIISDTFGRPWRRGLTNVAVGVAGLLPILDYRGQKDSQDRILQATTIAVADEIAAAAELVMGKTLGIPVAVLENFNYQYGEGSGRDLIRPESEDLFR